uniref:Large ribosomal subunit protein eL24-related N-terminal domain-containing protein n=1 Tax=Canis lupus dingo TaxID=286419 RepID=A0A8C0LGJ9_CANLU
TKVELCSFSGCKIYPGHGRPYARYGQEGFPVSFFFFFFQFLNTKCESAFLSKRNPRQINWTVLYRESTERDSRKKFKRKEPAVQSPEGHPWAISYDFSLYHPFSILEYVMFHLKGIEF